MRLGHLATHVTALVAISLAAPSAGAEGRPTLRFAADLTGTAFPDETGSAATGHASFALHPERGTLDVTLDVTGLNSDALADRLVAAPVGPMHLHLYLPNGSVVLIMAFPFGNAYRDTAGGLRMEATNVEYAQSAGLVGSERSFSEFVAALRSGDAYFNIHTDTFPDGEIAGKIREVSQP